MAVVFIVYFVSFQSQFVLDNILILQDSRIKELTWENLRLILGQEYWYKYFNSGLYRPVATFSYLVNYSILGNGNEPAGYHWINFFLHAANIILVYLLGLRVLERAEAALALAAVWGLHPVLTESVTNIVGRADLLAAFGVLAGVLCHAHAAAAERRRSLWIVLLMCAGAIGLFSKESAAVLPAAMLIFDLGFRKASWRRCVEGYVALAVPFLAYFSARTHALSRLPPVHFVFADNPLIGAGFWTSRLTAVKVIGKYLWILLWPASLSYDYSYNQVPLVSWKFNSLEDWQALFALTLCIALTVICIVCYRRNRPLYFFIAFFFVTLAPTANIATLIGSIMAERFLYLPSLGFAGCAVLAVYALCRSPQAARTALAAICVAFAARTYARNLDWLDFRALAAGGVQTSPASFKTHMSAAIALLNTGELDGSIREIETAMRILDSLPDQRNVPAVYINAGAYYRLKGERLGATPESKQWYDKARDTLLRARRIDLARDASVRREDEARGKPSAPTGSYQIYLELARTYLHLSAADKALESVQEGLKYQLAPDLLVEMANAYNALNQPRSAIVALLEARALDPNPRFTAGLVNLYSKADPAGCSIRAAGAMADINPDCPAVHDDLCRAHADLARRNAAATPPPGCR